MTSHSQAAVIVTFDQVGNDVVATWSGTLHVGAPVYTALFNWDYFAAGFNELIALSVLEYGMSVDGIVGSTSLSGLISGHTGDLGFSGSIFYLPTGSSEFVDFDVLSVSQTFGNQTLVGIGASAFDNTLAWTSGAGGTNTISYTTVPEPSSTALIGLGALALVVRRRR